MRNHLLVVLLATACATPAATTRPSPPSAGRASTESINATIRGDYAGALAAADRGLAAHPDDPWLLYDRGVALAGLGRIDESLPTLRRAEARFDGDHERSLAAYRRALTLEFAGRCAEASTEYSRYAALVGPSEPGLADSALAHLRFCVPPTAQQLAERRETERLRAVASEAERIDAERASTAAVEALGRGDYEGALTQADAGLVASPDDPWLLYNEGTALAGLGRLDEALAALRRAEARFSPENVHGRSVATYRRAIALEIAGRCEEESAELEHYASLVGGAQPGLAQHAATHLRFCRIANTRPTL
ncbi:MAG TPA: tetratricopeptide repeat protein [Polyangia bacterium]